MFLTQISKDELSFSRETLGVVGLLQNGLTGPLEFISAGIWGRDTVGLSWDTQLLTPNECVLPTAP